MNNNKSEAIFERLTLARKQTFVLEIMKTTVHQEPVQGSVNLTQTTLESATRPRLVLTQIDFPLPFGITKFKHPDNPFPNHPCADVIL